MGEQENKEIPADEAHLETSVSRLVDQRPSLACQPLDEVNHFFTGESIVYGKKDGDLPKSTSNKCLATRNKCLTSSINKNLIRIAIKGRRRALGRSAFGRNRCSDRSHAPQRDKWTREKSKREKERRTTRKKSRSPNIDVKKHRDTSESFTHTHLNE